MSPEFVIGFGVSVIIVSAVAALAGGRGTAGRLAGRARRVGRHLAGEKGDREPAAASVLRRTGNGGRSDRVMAALLTRVLPRPDLLRARLARTGRPIGIGHYAGLCVAVGVVVGAGCAIAGLDAFAAVAFGAAAGLWLPHWMVGRACAKREKAFESQFPEAIDQLVRGLRSGLPVGEMIASVGREAADPIGTEFRAIADAVHLGRPIEEALWEAAQRIQSREFRFFVISISVQRETGGNLAETLSNLSDILRRRRQMRLKIRAMSSEARASAMILGGLPFLMFALLFLMNPDYAGKLFIDERGVAMLIGGMASLLVGIVVMARMVRFEI